MRWRLVPSPQNRNAIPEPFRPTPLQYTTREYPLVIDFINWSSIRDQLILNLGSYDFDALIRDLVLNTVIDVPAFALALNVRDVFMTRVEGQNGLGGNDWSARNKTGTYPRTSNEILADIVEDMQLRSKDSGNAFPLNAGMDQYIQGVTENSTDSVITMAVSRPYDLSTLYGLDNLLAWKLSKEFAARYPFLDCSAGWYTFLGYSNDLLTFCPSNVSLFSTVCTSLARSQYLNGLLI